jgi:3-oxoadipate enol-lactonase
MPQIQINNVSYHYEVHGNGPQTLIFAHGLLWSGLMFHKQVAYFKNRYTVITYDHRGQGQTEASATGYDMDTLFEDAAAIIEQLSPNKPVIFAGLSMGGFIGMRLAARRPDLIEKLILIETSADPEPEENRPRYRTLNLAVKWLGVWAVVSKVMPIMFGQKFLNDASRKDERKFWENQMKQNRRGGIVRAVAGVIDRKGVADELHAIKCPTLVIVGDQDVATVPDKSKKIHSLIAGSELVMIAGGGHTSSVEEPEQVNAAIERFLK